ncbi:cell surface protein precursor [Lactobacillus selangorensis]|uniref:Cell surface protein n=1 Tax=Lactobacillus selangorensis TaxID=81857 RepID=A0A0R2FTD9_9LACO|nr:NlpC/P60 family protein [Lactobacillus selangorensis]KRN27988.1 cell surface protein precursor [Lactobacillus selangorensis]KRN30541.1 cell surface protein precursor [Lactobacillus selangorensis]
MVKAKIALLSTGVLGATGLALLNANPTQAATQTATVSYEKGATTVWDSPAEGQQPKRYLTKNQKVTIQHQKKVYGETWYEIGAGEWIPERYLKLDQATAQKQIQISYRDGSVTLWAHPGYTQPTGDYLGYGSIFDVVQEQQVGGETFYQLNNGAWVAARFVTTVSNGTAAPTATSQAAHTADSTVTYSDADYFAQANSSAASASAQTASVVSDQVAATATPSSAAEVEKQAVVFDIPSTSAKSNSAASAATVLVKSSADDKVEFSAADHSTNKSSAAAVNSSAASTVNSSSAVQSSAVSETASSAAASSAVTANSSAANTASSSAVVNSSVASENASSAVSDAVSSAAPSSAETVASSTASDASSSAVQNQTSSAASSATAVNSSAASEASSATVSDAVSSAAPSSVAPESSAASSDAASSAAASQAIADSLAAASSAAASSAAASSAAVSQAVADSLAAASSAAASSAAAQSSAAANDNSAASSSASTSTDRAAQIQTVINAAESQIGVPYVWGGHTANVGLDCSGLTSYAYSTIGVNLTPYTVAQESAGTVVSISNLEAGDLVFWGAMGNTYHVGIYIGGNQYIAAPQPGEDVMVSSISSYFYPSFGVRVI